MGSGPIGLGAAAVAKAAESTDFYTYQIANSIRYDGSSYMTKTFSGNRRTFTFKWSSLKFFKATVFILILKPIDFANSIPLKTFSKSPHLVICLYLSGEKKLQIATNEY